MAPGIYHAPRLADLQYPNVADEGRHMLMAPRLDEGQGHLQLDLQQRGDWGRHVRAGLSILASDPEGSCRNSDLWYQAEFVGALASVRDDVGRGCAAAGERRDATDAGPSDIGGLRTCDDSDRGDSEGRSEYVLPEIGEFDSAQLPDVSDGHRETPREATPEDTSPRLRYGTGLLSDTLDENGMVALDRLRTLMDLDIENEPDHEKLTANRKIVLAAARTSLETLTKVDENRLRKQEIDTLPQLLLDIAEYEKNNSFTCVETE